MNGRRFAKCDFRLDRAERTPEGYLQGVVPVTGCGVFPYRNVADDGSWDGTWRQELRHPDHVHDKASLDSLRMLPVQVEHVAMLGPENIDSLKVGHLGENYQIADDGSVRIPIRIDSPRGLAAIDSGKKELSMGYDLDLVPAPAGASFMGKPYTHIQTNIRYNHIAITDKARLGPQMRLDSADSVEDDVQKPSPLERPMLIKTRVDNIEYEAAPEVVNFLGKETKRADAAESKASKAEADLEAEKKEKAKGMDALQGKLDSALDDKKKAEDALESERKDMPAKVAQFAKDSAELMSVAQAVVPADEFKKMSAMDSKAIKVAVIKAKYPNTNLDGKSEDYLQSRFDSIKEDVKVTGSAANAQNRLDSSSLDNEDGLDGFQGSTADKARAKMVQRNQDAWMTPGQTAVAAK